MDPESAQWVRSLKGGERDRGGALDRLYRLLLRVAHREVRRRQGRIPAAGPELDDLAQQAAADALVAITAKIEQFRGESRFTTWACKFVVFEVSTKVGRHYWHNSPLFFGSEEWDRLPDRFGLEPALEAENREMVSALRSAVDRVLTAWQRQVFVALVLNGIPLDALVIELGSNRNALYKTLFDARQKLRADLVANHYLDAESSRRS